MAGGWGRAVMLDVRYNPIGDPVNLEGVRMPKVWQLQPLWQQVRLRLLHRPARCMIAKPGQLEKTPEWRLSEGVHFTLSVPLMYQLLHLGGGVFWVLGKEDAL